MEVQEFGNAVDNNRIFADTANFEMESVGHGGFVRSSAIYCALHLYVVNAARHVLAFIYA